MTSLLATDNSTNDIETVQTITELKIELQNTLALANDYKEENIRLKKELASTNAFSNANLQRHAEWKEVWSLEKDALALREKQLEIDEASNWILMREEKALSYFVDSPEKGKSAEISMQY